MASRLLAIFGVFILAVSATAAHEHVSDAARAAIRAVVQAQLDAFQADDAGRAFSFATPSIQARFQTPEIFMRMVVTQYQPVYRPRTVIFKETEVIENRVVQNVQLIDQNNRSLLALYPMEQQPDGSWRIDGCVLKALPGYAL